MVKKGYTPEQIIDKLREAEILLNQGATLAVVGKKIGVSDYTFLGVPEHIRSDNGSEFTARALRKWLEDLKVTKLYIEPGSPWENWYNESFKRKYHLVAELLLIVWSEEGE